MNVLANNCVSKISVPKGANSGNGVAYNPVLGLFVTMDFRKGISVWKSNGKVMAKRNLGEEGQLGMLILPGNRLAVSYSEVHRGGFLGIYPGGGTWVFFGWVCATRDSKLAPRSRKDFPSNWPIFHTPF